MATPAISAASAVHRASGTPQAAMKLTRYSRHQVPAAGGAAARSWTIIAW